ncbi:Homeobox-leucine zipper protein [Actinidia chinensis var. chinensis]|uniref:Homeobox-leucine zipper protein n=1 Tax=Actinidia chinensis var. chinensis TaxID=1590841 RepID=A0A2R6Q1A0_ACTCC|nr:Homeobox-leucine zipper protein [Actinidia chinensis var. chinensis]
MGISIPKIHILDHQTNSVGSSLDKLQNFVGLGQRIGGISLDNDHELGNYNDQALLNRLNKLQYSDISLMAQAISNATEELSSLFLNETLWIKDPVDGRLVIHRETYEKTFTRTNHLKSSSAWFESSKEKGFVRMNGVKLLEMLLDSTKRLDLFPTIITKEITLNDLITPTPGRQSGPLQLVYEQMHTLSPLLPPRDLYFLRYCHQIGEGSWMIVEVSYDIFDGSQYMYPYLSWRLPSGCLVRDMSNGCSMITWVEHVEVADKSLTHRLYRDLIFHNLAYGAERWLFTLQRMCERFVYEMMENRELGEVISLPEGRRSIMNLSQRMVKNLFANLTTKHTLDVPHLSEKNTDVRVSVCKSMGSGQSHALITNAVTSFWLPLPYQAVFDFLRDEKMRDQWDVLSHGIQFQEIAGISYGEHPGNCISIIQPLIPSENNVLVLQESSVDPLGAIVAYAPIDRKYIEMVISGADSCNIPILPSGFIIASDGHPVPIDGACSSCATANPSGSLLTVVFQILACDASSPNELNMEMVTSVNALIRSTVENIKAALNCTGLD